MYQDGRSWLTFREPLENPTRTFEKRILTHFSFSKSKLASVESSAKAWRLSLKVIQKALNNARRTFRVPVPSTSATLNEKTLKMT